MRNLLKFTIAALVLLFAVAAWAAIGTLGASITDAVTISIDGRTYFSARWIVRTAGTSTVTTEISLDGVKWIPATPSQRVDDGSASIAAWQNAAPVVGTFDTPLPTETTAFRVRTGTVGTPTVVQVTSGRPHAQADPPTALVAGPIACNGGVSPCTVTTVAQNILVANAARKGCMLQPVGIVDMYCKRDTVANSPASATNFDFLLNAGSGALKGGTPYFCDSRGNVMQRAINCIASGASVVANLAVSETQ